MHWENVLPIGLFKNSYFLVLDTLKKIKGALSSFFNEKDLFLLSSTFFPFEMNAQFRQQTFWGQNYDVEFIYHSFTLLSKLILISSECGYGCAQKMEIVRSKWIYIRHLVLDNAVVGSCLADLLNDAWGQSQSWITWCYRFCFCVPTTSIQHWPRPDKSSRRWVGNTIWIDIWYFFFNWFNWGFLCRRHCITTYVCFNFIMKLLNN